MVTFETTIKDHKVKLFSDFPLKNAAGAVLRTLAQISDKADIFDPKFVMCFGWAYFFLNERTDDNGETFWAVQTVDYRNDPMQNKTDNVTVSLLVQNMQIETVQTAKVQPEATTFKDTVLVLKEAMQAKEVYLNRADKTKNGDSGWYFGLLNDPNEENHTADDYEKMPSYQLLNFRSEALRILQMPVGTVAVINENKLTALVDGEDKPLKFTTDEERQKVAEAKKADEEEQLRKTGKVVQNGITFEAKEPVEETKPEE